MAKASHINQSQISGSLASVLNDSVANESWTAANRTLSDDLNALRSAIKNIGGGTNWHTALSGSQDLADIYAAVRVTGANSALQGTLSVSGNSTLASADIGGGFGSTGVTISGAGGIQANGALEVGGASMLSGSLNVLGASTLAAVNASGILTVTGNSVLASADIGGGFGSTGVTISGVGGIQANGALEVGGASMLSGSLNVLGASQFAAVNASGAVALASTLSAGVSTLASLVVTMGATVGTTLGVTGASTLASVGVTGGATVGGTLGVTGLSSLSAATVSSTLGVMGGASFSSTVAVTGASTFANISNQFNALSVTGSAGLAALGPASFSSTVGVTGALTAASPSNVMNGLSVTGSLGLSVSSNLSVVGNATVNGDLYVKGTTTYIQTDNMIVKDAFIYLATGSAGTTDSGIVLSRGAGASFDLILGQDSGVGEFVFAKQAVQAAFSSPAVINASALVPAWMSVAKIGANEGTLGGSLSMSGSNLLVKAESANSLKLVALGDEVFNVAIDGEQDAFDILFPSTSIIGAIISAKNSISSAALSQKGTLTSANVAANVLTFSSVGTLSSAAQKYIDVFLNGVLLAPVIDVVSVTTTTATLNADIGGSLVVDDVITVCLRSTTA